MVLGEIQCHHKLPRNMGGTDQYKNLVLVTETVHRLIHAVSLDVIHRYLKELNLTKEQMDKVNKLRTLADLSPINSI